MHKTPLAMAAALLAATLSGPALAQPARADAAEQGRYKGHWLENPRWSADDEPGHWFRGWDKPKRYLGRARPEPQQSFAPTGADFPMVGGNLGQQQYSALSGINQRNISQLGGAWRNQLEGGSTSQSQQNSVIAEAGVLYVQTSQGNVFAVDGKTGQTKWKHASGAGNMVKRGLALGGGKVYGTGAGRIVFALDKATGELAWKKTIDDPGISALKTAVMYHDGMIYLGSADGPRGSALALRASDGEIVWQVYGTAGPGEAGNESWEGTSWQSGGGSPWMHPAIDPALGLVYFTFGNARNGGAMSSSNGSGRGGDNLYANSIVALDLKTGQRRWHFQSVHHDIWDIDNTHAPLLADVTVRGSKRKAVFYGSKGGLMFILDRATGEPIVGVEEKPVPQEPIQKTSPTQPFPKGDPFSPVCPNPRSSNLAERPVPHYDHGCIFTPFWDKPTIVTPGTGGAADWNAYSFSPRTGLLYLGTGQINSAFTAVPSSRFFRPLGEYRNGTIVAIDPRTNRLAWERGMPWSLAHGNGILTTAGDLLFIGQPDGDMLALDVRTGRELWRFQTGAGVHTSPMSYEVDGEQYIAVFAGGNGLPYNSPAGDNLWAFKVGGSVPPATAPVPPPVRQPINATPVDGATVNYTVTLGRTWTNGAPSATENTTSDGAVAPQAMTVPLGATVTFVNPAGNVSQHCASAFFGHEFDSGVLAPGQSFTHTFTSRGEVFFNNCVYPNLTGKIIVQ